MLRCYVVTFKDGSNTTVRTENVTTLKRWLRACGLWRRGVATVEVRQL
jgi:hypothetical protein